MQGTPSLVIPGTSGAHFRVCFDGMQKGCHEGDGFWGEEIGKKKTSICFSHARPPFLSFPFQLRHARGSILCSPC